MRVDFTGAIPDEPYTSEHATHGGEPLLVYLRSHLDVWHRSWLANTLNCKDETNSFVLSQISMSSNS